MRPKYLLDLCPSFLWLVFWAPDSWEVSRSPTWAKIPGYPQEGTAHWLEECLCCPQQICRPLWEHRYLLPEISTREHRICKASWILGKGRTNARKFARLSSRQGEGWMAQTNSSHRSPNLQTYTRQFKGRNLGWKSEAKKFISGWSDRSMQNS